MNWYFEPWKKFAKFSGRARRKEYWIFTFVNWLIWLILYGVLMLGMGFSMDSWSSSLGIGSILIFLFYILTLIPTYAVMVRRLHDTGRSGWWFFINFVPFIGSFILLFFLLSDSQTGNNKYGENPKMRPYQQGYAPNVYNPPPPSYIPPAAPSAFCRNCGAQIVGNAAFCQNCGAKR